MHKKYILLIFSICVGALFFLSPVAFSNTNRNTKQYVFASFSIPKAHLRQLLYDAKQKKIPVVFRGLVNNSFQDTLKKLHDVDPDHQTAFQINPKLFKHYHVSQVPTLVVDEEELKTHQHKTTKIVGDVGLERAIEYARNQRMKQSEQMMKNIKNYIPRSIKQPDNPPNTSFEKSVSEFSSITHAGESMNRQAGDPKLMQMFVGSPEYCRITMLHYRNCCQKSGWGVDIHLASCRHNEKELAIKRKQKLCIPIGRYCAKKVLGKCTEYHQTFCCYSHPLAKIVQSQGRPQLHLGFGTPQHPNCSGFTPAQLQHLQFDQMDFQSFYHQLRAQTRPPSADQLRHRLHIQTN